MKNEYKTICDTCGKKTWYETEQQCHCVYPEKETCSTCGHSEEVYLLKDVRCKGTLRKIDNSELDNRLTRYYENGQRIEVIWKDGYEDYSGYGLKTNGKKARFYVGKSTGWKPIYLQIYSTRSFGGGSVLSSAIESIKPLNKYR